jgi:pimeloyl-ACP methyl ester carboxylesterase
MGLETMRLKDGRTLEYCLTGPSDAADLLVLHLGGPMGAVDYPPATEAAAARGIRTVTYSRPGYANSTPKRDWVMADAAQDTAALADHLGADTFLVAGWSAGGDPALACAALLPERVRACISIAGRVPPDEIDEDWTAWYRAADREWYQRLLRTPLEDLVPEYERAAEEFAATTVQSADEWDQPEIDKEANHRYPAGAEALVEAIRRSVSTGIWGFVGDEMAWVHPWGFRLDDIRIPVTIRHGTADRNVPVEHGRWLAAHTPGARAQILDGHGHVSIAMPFEPVVEALLQA